MNLDFVLSVISTCCVVLCAGLVKRGEHIHVSPSEKAAVSSSASVFSRLDGKGRVSPTIKTYSSPHNLPPPSSTSSPPPPPPPPGTKRTVLTAASPSPQKVSLRVTARDGRRVSTTTSGGGGGPGVRASGSGNRGGGVARLAKRESSGGGLVSSSSSSSAKEPVKNRLGAREHGVGYGRSEGWTDTVSTSSHSSRVPARLGSGGGSGGTHRGSMGSTRRTRPTMVADSATNPPAKASSRLGSGHKNSSSSSAAVVSSATRTRGLIRRGEKAKAAPSMKADEYEMRRQLDIRSRLAAKEKEVEARRSGPLRGRLGQHRVFQRLT